MQYQRSELSDWQGCSDFYAFLREKSWILTFFLSTARILRTHYKSHNITDALFDVWFLSICSVIGVTARWEDFEEIHHLWLQEKILFPQGIPANDTMAGIISRLNPTQLRQCFIVWANSMSKWTSREIIAIDGNTLKSSYNPDKRQSAIHLVSAFTTLNGVVKGQIKTEDKSNDITVTSALLKFLHITGYLVSKTIHCKTDCDTNRRLSLAGSGEEWTQGI